MATLAMFVALGGVSYAALRVPQNSVGTRQLKDGAVTAKKIRNQAITGAQLNLGSLGTVPSAGHADNASHANSADSSARAESADFSTGAANALRLAGHSGKELGPVLVGHTDVPATASNTELWGPISGAGQAVGESTGIGMATPNGPTLYASGLVIEPYGGPEINGAAEVTIGLYIEGREVQYFCKITRFSGCAYDPVNKVTVPPGSVLSIKINEQPHGEEIPAFSIATGVQLSASQ